MASMVAAWPTVALSEVLFPVDRVETPVVGKAYRTIGVKWWGEGVYERGTIDGSQTQYSVLRRIQAGDIIINKIWARHGSVAVVQPVLDGCYASTEFPTWTARPDRLEPRWMHWLSKTRAFWAECDEKSRGTSGKNRIRPERFLEIEIPLPPLDEQRRIVACIEALAARITEARGLRQAAIAEVEALWSSAISHVMSELPDSRPLGELAEVICGQHLGPDEQASEGIPYITGPADFTAKVARPSRFASVIKAASQPGDVLLTVKGAGVGKVNLAPSETAVIGRQLYAIRPKSLLSQTYLWIALQHRLSELRDAITATTVPGIARDDVEPLSIPLPPLVEQQRLVDYLDEVHARAAELQGLMQESDTELHALLPSVLDKAFRGEL